MKISMSGYKKYMTCPHSFKLHYKDRIRPLVKSSALAFGAALDTALNALLEDEGDAYAVFDDEFKGTDKDLTITWDKMDYDPLLLTDEEKSALLNDCNDLGYPGNDIDDLMVDLFKIQGRNGVYFNRMSDAQKGCIAACASFCMRKKAQLMIQTYIAEILVDLSDVNGVQEEIRIGDSVRGYLDFIANYKGQKILFDNKTAKRPYTNHNIISGIQLPLYAKAKDLYQVGYIVISKEIKHYKKRPPRVDIRVMTFEVDKDFATEVADTIAEVKGHVDNGVFPKNLTACHQIFGKPCDYLNYCRKGDMTGLEVKDESTTG